MRRRAAALIVALAALFVAAPAASAENGTSQDGYGGVPVVQVPLEESAEEAVEESTEEAVEEAVEESAEVFRPPVVASAGTEVKATSPEGTSAPGQPVSTQVEAAATLPVTGAELAFVFVAGALLVLVGFGMNRLARPRRSVR